MGVAQLGRDLDLAENTLGAQRRRQLRAEYLDRYLAVVLDVAREEHDGHAAGTEFPLEIVVIGEGRLEALKEV